MLLTQKKIQKQRHKATLTLKIFKNMNKEKEIGLKRNSNIKQMKASLLNHHHPSPQKKIIIVLERKAQIAIIMIKIAEENKKHLVASMVLNNQKKYKHENHEGLF